MNREKIGTEYYRSGYGRTRPRKANVYLIEGFAYARDKAGCESSFIPLTGELEGYVRVNVYYNRIDGRHSYYQVSGITSDDHKPYVKK